ncbi:hypothetical protein [Gemmatimonas sp.]|nr:hypothetical protein [Gemmatimonas sp.]
MTITFRSRPLTPAETAAGWEAVLVPDVPQLKAKILGATIVVA